MDFQTYFSILWRKKWSIVIMVMSTLIAVSIGSFLTPRIYSATSTIRIASASGGSLSYTDFVYSDRLVNTYVKIATSRPVIDELVNRLHLNEVPSIRVEVVPNTELINITVEDQNPLTALKSANALANILIEQSSSLYSGGGRNTESILSDQLAQLQQEINAERTSYDQLIRKSTSNPEDIAASLRSIELKQKSYEAILTQYEDTRLRNALRANIVSIIEEAILPESPIRPNYILNLGLGLLISIVAAIGLVFLFERFDKTLHTSNAIEKALGQSAMAKIPETKSDLSFITMEGNFQYGEAYRRLGASFLYQIQGLNYRVVMITSPDPEDGKSTICSNLAILLSQAGKKVILVDSDPKESKIHEIFDLPNEVGLTNILAGKKKVKDALKDSKYDGLRIMTSGPFQLTESMTYPRINIRDIMTELSSKGDIVLIDSPSIFRDGIGIDLATSVDAVLVVLRRASTKIDILEETRKHLEKLNAHTMGYVINWAESQENPKNNGFHKPTNLIPPVTENVNGQQKDEMKIN